MWVWPIYSTPNRLACPQNLFHCSWKVSWHGPGTHSASYVNHLVHSNITIVFNCKTKENSITSKHNQEKLIDTHALTVFLLLSVSWRLLEGLDNERSSTRNHLNFGLSILDGQLDCDFQSFPLLCCLGNIISYFLWWLIMTEREEFLT